ncbi:type II toxin-antitoxin system VapC family toxin [Cryobacterium tepidiphilum]|uniref:Ribonuclease VapC n=1 Tax=Cryobacterium tepidiphilum TaxID=2486026 RepID=A0A3M8LHI2_9MICO|nr:type II toxin-antitoxin system VapC family toxin [Cryobacterium tepidiphilum]RNE64202.1 type II toxin-antitoxin system VapC family toxin [Cryobacterium tepidiphilum]
MIIVDTNVFSALMSDDAKRLEPWLATVSGPELFTTAITRAEIRYGIERLPRGRRQVGLRERADLLFSEIDERILVFDSAAADRYGVLVASRERAGRPISVPDAQVASIALVHRAMIATRNVRDFADTGVTIVNPFESN